MGEMSDCWLSDEEKAIERIVERRFKAQNTGWGTDATDRADKDKIKQEVIDEFILANGRRPKGIYD